MIYLISSAVTEE